MLSYTVAASIGFSGKKHCPYIFTEGSAKDENRPLLFISLSHSDKTNQSTTKFYNSSKADVWGNMLTLTSCVLRFDWIESFWMPTDVKFLIHSIHLLKKKLRHLTGHSHYLNKNLLGVSWVGVGGVICTCNPSVCDLCVCKCACMHVCECVQVTVRVLCFSMCQFDFV